MAGRETDKSQANAAGRKAKGPGAPKPLRRYALVLVLLGACALGWTSVLTFSPSDPPSGLVVPPKDPVDNAAGIVGAYLAYSLLYYLGSGVYMVLLFGSVATALVAFGGRVGEPAWRIIGVVLLLVGTSTAVHMLNPFAAGYPLNFRAGVLGIATGDFLLSRFSRPGGWIILLVTLAVGLMLTADRLVLQLPRWGRKAWARGGQIVSLAGSIRDRAAGLGRPVPAAAGSVDRAAAPSRAPGQAAKTRGPQTRRIAFGDPGPRSRPTEAPPKGRGLLGWLFGRRRKGSAVVELRPPPGSAGPLPPASAGASGSSAAPSAVQPPAATGQKPAAERAVPPSSSGRPGPPAPVAPQTRCAASGDPPRGDSRGKAAEAYHLPSADLLEAPSDRYQASQEAVAAQRKVILQQTLNDFAVAAEVLAYQTGPVITVFELSLSPGVKVSQVSNLCPDIARALAVPGVRVVSPLPGKDTIGIEVPNLDKEIVRIRELMAMAPDAERQMALPLYLGKDAGGDPIVSDLGKMPHILIAGTTGSGKSVCLNAIILALLMTRRPEDVRLILVDPKMVEMAAFEDIPHLLCPIVNDMRKAEEILEWAAMKMDERYELFKEAGVKNVAAFNRLSKTEIYQRFEVTSEEEKARVPTHMSYYVIIVDELADLIMTSSKEVENYIIRISQKARAVGIHLILATQRPSVNVVTGLIKSNMPCRISFRVASRQESRIVLDQNGAEVLLGQGDMLFLRPGTSTLIRAQGCYVEEAEIRTVVGELRKHGGALFDPELMRLHSRPAGEDSGQRDELFDQAVEIVLASQRGSVSLLQRRLAVGYSRASRIIDQMAEAGILGDYKGSQARECLMTLEEWQQLQDSIAADRSGQSSANGEPTSV